MPTSWITARVVWRRRMCWSSWAITPASSSGVPVRSSRPWKITTWPPGAASAFTTGRFTT